MQNIINFLQTDTYLIILAVITIILMISFLIVLFKLNKLNKKYKNFMSKLGNGNNIEENLQNYMNRVEEVERQNGDILKYCNSLKQEMASCIQKVGLVRYNAFQDTGSDLSFALALLDEKNNGVVLNGIYSREMSNIYGKSVENGTSNYTISEEEKEAIEKAMSSKEIYSIH